MGTTAAVKGGQLNNVWRHEKLMRRSKRGVQDVRHSPAPSRINKKRIEDAGTVSHRRREHGGFTSSLATMPVTRHADTVGRNTGTHNKLPTLNPRMGDLGLARKQLECNPYTMSLG
jgi:hypothetical protein